MAEVKDVVKSLSQKHGKERSSLLPILQGITKTEKHLSAEVMIEVAKELDISTAEVYGTASFYSFLDTEPRGEYIIRVCKTISCDMKGKRQLVKTLEDLLKIKVGETTHNKKFTLLETNCLGWCHKAPAMLINDEVYTELDSMKIRKIIRKYQNK